MIVYDGNVKQELITYELLGTEHKSNVYKSNTCKIPSVKLGEHFEPAEGVKLPTIEVYGGELEECDIDKLYLLACMHEYVQEHYAQSKDYLLKNIKRREGLCVKRGDKQGIIDRIDSTDFDLRKIKIPSGQQMRLLVVTRAIGDPVFIYDGNHRAIAHYCKYGSICGIPIFIVVQSELYAWGNAGKFFEDTRLRRLTQA